MQFLYNNEIKDNKHLGKIHFIGIGGIGMSGIAEIMHNLGFQIQGSNIVENTNTQRLEKLGIKIFHYHRKENILGVQYIVISSAIKNDNIEVVSAIKKNIPILTRAEMLGELMRFKFSIAVSGSHGKTTTTSLIACLIETANLNPTVINGGIINNKSTNAYLGKSPYLVAEADESDGTFIKIPASVAVITNIDPEHLDYYKSFQNLINAFKQFILKIPFYSFAVACIDHDIVFNLIKRITTREIITYGINNINANIHAFNIKMDYFSSQYDVKINIPKSKISTTIKDIYLPIPGKHNILNSLAAIAIAIKLKLGTEIIQRGFATFEGIKRRFSKIYEYLGISIIDDYAHHPEEIKATLATAKNITNKFGGRIISIYQPHRYSRLKYLFNDFVNCFNDTDELYITDVYSAGESELSEFNSDVLLSVIIDKKKFSAKKFNGINQIIHLINNNLKQQDLILFIGAGNINQISQELISILKKLQ